MCDGRTKIETTEKKTFKKERGGKSERLFEIWCVWKSLQWRKIDEQPRTPKFKRDVIFIRGMLSLSPPRQHTQVHIHTQYTFCVPLRSTSFLNSDLKIHCLLQFENDRVCKHAPTEEEEEAEEEY